MAFRGIRMQTRTGVVREVIGNRFNGLYVTVNTYPNVQSPAFHDVNVRSNRTSNDGLKLTVRIPTWGMGKPKVRYEKNDDRGKAELLAADIRKKGLYLFTPKVEQIYP